MDFGKYLALPEVVQFLMNVKMFPANIDFDKKGNKYNAKRKASIEWVG